MFGPFCAFYARMGGLAEALDSLCCISTTRGSLHFTSQCVFLHPCFLYMIMLGSHLFSRPLGWPVTYVGGILAIFCLERAFSDGFL